MKTHISGAITSIAFGGSGIMRHLGRVIFVPHTAVGDEIDAQIVDAKKSFAKARLIKVLSPGAGRIDPICDHAQSCGGCQFQHLSYRQQLASKMRFVEDAFLRIAQVKNGAILPIEETEHQWHYRRHIRLHLRDGRLGFVGQDNHSLIEIDQCPIFSDDVSLFADLKIIVQELARITPASEVLIVKANDRKRYLLYFKSVDAKPLNIFFTDLLARYPWIAGISWNDHHVGENILSLKIDGLNIAYGPQAFMQAHPEQSERLYLTIKQLIMGLGKTNVLDLYCGVGITSLLLAREGLNVTAIEGNPRAIGFARQNALANNVHPRWIVGDVDDLASKIISLVKPDIVLLNPPRTGLDQRVIDALISFRPSHIFYVSCMPATLARDVKKFLNDYEITYCRPFDMFPQTTHVETLIHIRAAAKSQVLNHF